ncbi:hypothetical protein ACFO4E_16840 [Nocardiopsis mangrovi]|uniref:Uncharacterized protein n=1 Tax=Nocardiopsis mangrovi TaxID=1179818 RepID=A0ABV9DZY2_9ACTN
MSQGPADDSTHPFPIAPPPDPAPAAPYGADAPGAPGPYTAPGGPQAHGAPQAASGPQYPPQGPAAHGPVPPGHPGEPHGAPPAAAYPPGRPPTGGQYPMAGPAGGQPPMPSPTGGRHPMGPSAAAQQPRGPQGPHGPQYDAQGQGQHMGGQYPMSAAPGAPAYPAAGQWPAPGQEPPQPHVPPTGGQYPLHGQPTGAPDADQYQVGASSGGHRPAMDPAAGQGPMAPPSPTGGQQPFTAPGRPGAPQPPAYGDPGHQNAQPGYPGGPYGAQAPGPVQQGGFPGGQGPAPAPARPGLPAAPLPLGAAPATGPQQPPQGAPAYPGAGTGGQRPMGGPTGAPTYPGGPTGGHPPMGGMGGPTGGRQPMGGPWGTVPADPQQPLQGRIVQPGTPVPDSVEEAPVFPPDAGAATQNMNAVVDDGATQAIPPVTAEYGGRQMFRDESPRGGDATAEINLSGMDDYTPPPGPGRGSDRGSGGGLSTTAKVLMGVGFVVLLVAGGGGAFWVATSGGSGGAGIAGGDAPASPASLESGDLFPGDVEVAGQPYTLAITDDTTDCDTVAHGEYGQVLADNDCRQIVRATYVNEDATRAVTVGIAAMGTPEDAGAALEAQDPGEGEWFAGLAGQEGTGAERMAFAAGHGSGGQWGPYLLYSLAANSDGRAAAGQSDELSELSDDFVEVPMEPLAEQSG